ncbi:hypothetical protein WDJ50_02575 [Deinococcus sp. VB142]|uniref:Uncharacterized protein n=1 Tax=Deinococcus sp. VB142 TaxID=3112952 RepID=A0AAU6Q498_9DEIO
MTLPGRAEAQALGRPLLQKALDQQGVSVTVIRVGGATLLVALFVPVSPDGRQVVKVANPDYAQQPAKFFFRHDADPVREPGFSLLKGGRLYTPVTPTVDVADQGIALMLMAQPLNDRTRTERLTFTLPGKGMGRDNNGNPVSLPGVSLTVTVRLVAVSDPRIRDMVGADAADMVLVGRWGTLEQPLLKPDGLKWGMTSPLVLDGQNGTLTLKLAYPDPDLAQESQFGARFLAIWRANS